MLATTKSSKWLHRLRTSRGFPDSDHMNLEHFLSNSLHNKIDPQISDKRPPIQNSKSNDDPESTTTTTVQGRDIINNALSELFQMGEFHDLSTRINRKKKSCRKQLCPRICVLSTNSTNSANSDAQKNKNPSPLPIPVPVPVSLPVPLTVNGKRKAKERNREFKVTERVEEKEKEEEEERGYGDLTNYSQTEVTIIDTSVASWKFEKVLYRRKNAWKVGDKKGKGLMSGGGPGDRKKKRKEGVNENGGGGGGDVEKKKKLLKVCGSSSSKAEEGGLKKKKKKKRLKACGSRFENVDNNEEVTVRSKSAQGHEHCKTMAAVYEKKQDNYSFPPKKQIDGGSSVILIKSIPTTNKKDNSGIPKSCSKSMHK